MTRTWGLLAGVLLLAACPENPPPEASQTAAPRRWARPPSSAVRAYPPHPIRANSVGPYEVGMALSAALHLLPEGPRVELLQLGDLARWRIVRAEGGALLLGADEENKVAFVSVVSGPVASTEQGGVGVGASGAELIAALGPEWVGPRTWDRRVIELQALPGVHFITDAAPDVPLARTRVIAIVITSAPPAETAAPPTPMPHECRSGGPLAAAADEFVGFGRASGGRTGQRPMVRFGCVTGSSPEAIVVGPGVLELVGGEAGHLRRLARLALPAADLVAPVDLDGDGRDEVVIGVIEAGSTSLTVSLTVLYWDGGRLVPRVSSRPITLSASAASAAGTSLAALDLALSFASQGGDLELGGFFLVRTGRALSAVAPLEPVRVRLALGRREPVIDPPKPAAPRADAHPAVIGPPPAAQPIRSEEDHP